MVDKALKPIVHIATDEKFIDAAYAIYEEAFPGLNLFMILQSEDQKEIKYLTNLSRYCFVITNKDYLEKISSVIADAKIIVFHGMNYFQALLAHIVEKHSKKYVWTVFGTEVYENEFVVKNPIVGEKTYKEFMFSNERVLKNKFRSIYYLLWKWKRVPKRVIKDSFYKMDFISVLYEEELNYYNRLGIVNKDSIPIKFTYYPLDVIIKKEIGFVNQANILLGNSGAFTNNHLEAFEILNKFNSSNFRIITPLNYGNKEYSNKIMQLGNLKFGERFQPLIDFMPLVEYQKILKSCGVVIMNHHRQQAVGNVMNALYLGAKVYLSQKNTLYQYLKRIGCNVYCIERDLVPTNINAFELLTLTQMLENRRIVSDELSFERVVNELKSKLSPSLFG